MNRIKKSMILLFIVILLTSIGFAKNQTEILTKNVKLTLAAMQKTNALQSFELLNSLNAKDRAKVIAWVQKNPEKFAPFYYMYFADEIFKKNKDEAALWYFIGRIRATEDVQMCMDSSAAAQISIYPMLAPKTMEYLANKNNDKYLEEIIKKAVTWDEMHPQRVNPIWSCYHGIEALSNEPQLLPMNNYKKIQEETRQDILKSLKNKK